jgi:DDE_Tnp_1-associated
MTAFTHLLDLLGTIPDPRRAQGKLYTLPHLLLFAILAVVAGANSYRGIHSFIDVHLDRLKATFDLRWRRAPADTSIRLVLQNLDPAEMERVWRIHAAVLADQVGCEGVRVVAFDGKTLRGSFDHFADRAAVHLVSAFEVTSGLILGHLEVGETENEIPAVQHLLSALGLSGRVVTADALHCQKNLRGRTQ